MARSSKLYTDYPHVYPGTRYALRGEVAEQWIERLVPKSKNSGWLFPDDLLQNLFMTFGVGAVGYIYTLGIEVPMALVADTVLLPRDIREKRSVEAKDAVFANVLFGNTWPVPPEILRTNYNRKKGNPLIDRLLRTPETTNHRAKILCLIDAGVGCRHIAGYSALDDEMAARLVAHGTNDCTERIRVLNALAQNPLTPPNVMMSIIQAGPFGPGPQSPLDALEARSGKMRYA